MEYKYIRNPILLILVLISTFSAAQELASYRLSDCDADSHTDLVKRRIVSKTLNNDTLSLQIGFVENCCLLAKPSIRSSNDTLFLSLKNTSDTYCSCVCCFEMELKISKMRDTNFVLMWGQYAVKTQSKYPKLPHEYRIDENTPVGLLNSDSLKIGLWYEFLGSEGRMYEIYYDLNPTDHEIMLWSRVYNKDGELEEIAVRQGRYGSMIHFEPKQYSTYFEKSINSYK